MADITMIQSPKIAVAASSLDASRVVGQRQDARTPGAPIGQPPLAPAPRQRRAGQFGAPTGVVIRERTGAPVTPLPAQSLRLLQSLLGNLVNYCSSVEGATAATKAAQQTLTLVKAITNGVDISDSPAPAPAK